MSITIRFATDFVCPYCIAAKETLLQAIEGHKEVSLELLPLELTKPPKERVDTYHDAARREKWAQELIPFCKEIGLEAHFPPAVVPRPYTTLAWEGWHYARACRIGNAYANLMYEAYFVEQLDIGDINVLCALAAGLGLDPKDFKRALEAGTYREKQEEMETYTRCIGVKSVPTIWVNGTKVLNPLMTREEWESLLFGTEEKSEAEAAVAFGCGPEGC